MTRWVAVWMDTNLTFKENHNQSRKKARAAEVLLWSLIGMYQVILACVGAVQIAWVQVVML